MKAVILAGGKGTRMGNLTRETPKPMLKIGGEPVLSHQIKLLKKYGIKDILILVNHLKDPIIEYFKDESAFGVFIDFFEEQEPLGTVGGIKEVEYHLQEDFLVLYGDVMINMDLGRLISYHKKKKSECTLVLHPNDHPIDSDLVEMDTSGKITGFYPKPHESGKYYPNMVNAGAYVFSPSIFRHIEKGKKADFGREVFPRIYSEIDMYGYNTAEYLKDMGTPERLKEVEKDFRTGKIKRSSYEFKQNAIFLDRDGVINEEISFISKLKDMKLYPYTAEAIKKINQSEYKAIVITNQSVIARNLCTLEELNSIHNKMDTELGNKKAKIDALYYCPHHPDRGYPEERKEYKIECLCRKPQPGMLLDAAFDFNIDLESSFMIGDNERDIQAGKNAGCTTVGVATGYGIKNATLLPDFFFADLNEAVDFLCNEPYKKVFEKISAISLSTPSVLLIGGKARSGKSTLSSYLAWKFRRAHKKVLQIELDNWILPVKKRQECKNVFDRFQLPEIETDIQQILAGIEVSINRYPAHPSRTSSAIPYQYSGQDIIIIEGVVALSSSVLRKLSHYKIFVDIDIESHKSRVYKYYRWRGLEDGEIEVLYEERLKDEYNLIEKERKLADLVVNSISE